jgi:hypothetical protein
MTKTIFRLCAAALLTASFASTSAFGQRAAGAYGKLPLSFEPNRGQTDARVQFVSRGSGYTIFLEPNAATFAFHHPLPAPKLGESRKLAADATRQDTVRMRIVGGNGNASFTPGKELPGYVNYMHGSNPENWHIGIPTYAATTVQGVYPGVDLVYYGTQRELEYDFVVKPGSDPAKIRLAMDGAHPRLSSSGDLLLQLANAPSFNGIRLRKPVLYQKDGDHRRPIEGAFTLAANGEVGIRVGAYDHSRELVIDPILAYASYFGGAGNDFIYASVLNSANQLYIAGTTTYTLPNQNPYFQLNPPSSYAEENGNPDGFVSKISADGTTVLWTTSFGGSSNQQIYAIAVNAQDQAYVTGSTGSQGANGINTPGTPGASFSFPITSDAIQVLCGPVGVVSFNPSGEVINSETSGCGPGAPDAFISKLSSDGKTLLYSTFLGGSQNETGVGIQVDANGLIYVAGITNSTNYDNSSDVNLKQPAYPYDYNGILGYGQADFPTTGNAYNQSYSLSRSLAPPGQDNNGQNTINGVDQAFLTVLSADGHSFVYSTTIGGANLGNCGNGPCDTYMSALTISPQGHVYLAGETSSATWPITSGAFTSVCPVEGNGICPQTAFLSVFDPTKSGAASLVFSTYLAGTSGGANYTGANILPTSAIYGLTTDATGNIYTTGTTTANDFPTTAGVFQPKCALPSGDGNADVNICNSAFITKLSPTGATIWSTLYRGTKPDGNGATGSGIALDAKGNVYVVGISAEPTIPLTKTLAVPYNNFTDAFLIELSPDASTLLLGTFLGATNGINVSTNSLQLDSNNNAYFSGYQQYSTNGGQTFPTTPNAFAKTGLGGSSDGWIVKMGTVPQTSTTAITVSPSTPAPGQSVTISATVTGLTGAALPTGTVSLASGTTSFGTITLVNGTGSVSSSTIPVGTYNIVGTYSSDVSYAASVSTSQMLAITVTPTVTFTATPATAALGTGIVLKATVASSASTPTGTVYFMDGTTTLGSAVLSGGTASYTASGLAVGTHSITVRYGGDGANAVASSTAQTVTITTITPTVTLTATPSTTTIGTAVALSATVGGGSGTTTPTGTVKFYDGTTLLSSFTLSGTSGVATYSAAALAVGSHSITAVYSGDANYVGLTAAAQTVTVNLNTPALTFTASPATGTVGVNVTLSATVLASSGSGIPTGSVKFLDGTTVLTTVQLTGTSASYSTTALAAGSHALTAAYGGDGNFSALTSGVQTVTITAIPPTVSLTANPSSLTIKSGTSGTTTITVTPAGGYSGTITFACGTLPSSAACSFAPATLVFSGGATAQTTVLTINTSITTQAMLETPGRHMPMTVFAALLLLPLALRKRSRALTRSDWKALSLIALLSIAGVIGLSGCGSSGGGTTVTNTPAGTYSIPVTVSGGTATNPVSLQVTVQ